MMKLENFVLEHKWVNEKVFFVVMLTVGLLVRIYVLVSQDIFIDEVFYMQAAKQNSLVNLMSHNFWIKDHGMMYPLFLKLIQYFTINITLLRLTNLLLYLVVVFALFKFFQKIKSGYTSLIPVALFSFLPYFVYINSYILPYNFVLSFSIFAFISISNFVLFPKSKRNQIINGALFIIFLTLAFYSDYSVIYFYLALIPLAIFEFRKKGRSIENLTLLFSANVLLITPGVYNLLTNFHYFYNLNPRSNLIGASIAQFFGKFSSAVFFNSYSIFSSLLLLLLLVLSTVVILKTNDIRIRYLGLTGFLGFIIDFIFLYFFNNLYFSAFIERTFWCFNFFLILIFYCLTVYLGRTRKILLILVLLLGIFIVGKFYFVKYDPPIIGNKNIHYKTLVSNLLKLNINYKTKIVIIDNNKSYREIPLTEYYFQGYNYLNKNESDRAMNLFNQTDFVSVTNLRWIEFLNYFGVQKIIFVILDYNSRYYSSVASYVASFENTNNFNIKNIYYGLKCDYNNCYFYRLN